MSDTEDVITNVIIGLVLMCGPVGYLLFSILFTI